MMSKRRGYMPHGILGLITAALIGLSASPVAAQPFNGFMVLDGDATDYIQIPHSTALNPTGAITLEGWVRFDAIGCVSLIGKNFLQAFWVGPCNAFRSYTRGSGSNLDGGTFSTGVWTHFAVTDDGTTRNHYLNGITVGTFPVAGPLTSSLSPVRIGSDVSWEFTPQASLDEFRLWNVARTQGQILSTMNTAISTPQAGLVAVWPLDVDGRDALGVHNGAIVGSPVFSSGVPSMPGLVMIVLTLLLLAIAARTLPRSRSGPTPVQ